MKYFLYSAVCLCVLSERGMSQLAVEDTPKAVPLDPSVVVEGQEGGGENVSSGLNKQFKVRGESLKLNKLVTGACDRLAGGVCELLGEARPEGGFYPINVILYSKGDKKRGQLYKTLVTPISEGGFRIDLFIDIREKIDRSVLEAGVMQAIVMERTLRTDPLINDDSVVDVPGWVSDGLLGALRWKEGQRDRGMYEVLTRKPELFIVDRLFTTKASDLQQMGETMHALYNASATAMIMSLSRQPDGKTHLANLLSEVAVFEGETAELLRKNFPAMNVGEKGLQKLWNLQLAEMAAPRLIDTQTLIVTEEKLRDLLFFSLIDENRIERKVDFNDFSELADIEKEEQSAAILRLGQNLGQLSYRAYPDYQPILAEYGLMLTSISRGETKGMAERIERLEEERKIMYENGIRARDILDWYELSKARDLKGDFTGYQRLLERMKVEKKLSESNEVSTYVNQVEQLMKR